MYDRIFFVWFPCNFVAKGSFGSQKRKKNISWNSHYRADNMVDATMFTNKNINLIKFMD